MRRAQPWRTNRARILRANETQAEAKLWSALRSRRLDGLKFVRQAPVGSYYVDFLCRERRIIVEIDGGTHSSDAEIEADAARDMELRRLGYRIFRATNSEVYANVVGVVEALLAFADETG